MQGRAWKSDLLNSHLYIGPIRGADSFVWQVSVAMAPRLAALAQMVLLPSTVFVGGAMLIYDWEKSLLSHRLCDGRKWTVHYLLHHHQPRPKLFRILPLPALPFKSYVDTWRLHDSSKRGGALFTADGAACGTCGCVDSEKADLRYFYGESLNELVWSCTSDLVAHKVRPWIDLSALDRMNKQYNFEIQYGASRAKEMMEQIDANPDIA